MKKLRPQLPTGRPGTPQIRAASVTKSCAPSSKIAAARSSQEVQSRMKDVRADTGQAGVVDDVETSESDIQDEIEFALIQMKAETLHRINEALERLEEGTYGRCFKCGEESRPRRLRALPFAVQAARTARKHAKSRHSASGSCPAGLRVSVSTCRTDGRLGLSRRSPVVTLRSCLLSFAGSHVHARSRRFTFCRPHSDGPSPSRVVCILARAGTDVVGRQGSGRRRFTSRQERLYERGIRTPRGRGGLEHGTSVHPRLVARAAAARHGALPQLVHATGRGPRGVGPADRRVDDRQPADRGLHPARRHCRGADRDRPLRDRDGHPHPQDVQAA